MVPADDNLAAGLAVQSQLAALREELARKDGFIAYQQERIEKLEAALEEARRSGNVRLPPFSKGKPKTDPARPGRKRDDGHGRHGHRRAPTAYEPDGGGEALGQRASSGPFSVKMAAWVGRRPPVYIDEELLRASQG